MRLALKNVAQALAKALTVGELLLLCAAAADRGHQPVTVPVAGSDSAAAPDAWPSESLHQLPVMLESSRSRKLMLANTAGRVRIVSMFYASCPMVCPMTFETVRQIEAALPVPERSKLGVILVTIDPTHDTPPVLHDLAQDRHVDDARWLIARAGEEDTRALATALGIQYRPLGDGNFNHSTVLVLLDPAGRIIARSSQIGTADREFVRAVHQALASK